MLRDKVIAGLLFLFVAAGLVILYSKTNDEGLHGVIAVVGGLSTMLVLGFLVRSENDENHPRRVIVHNIEEEVEERVRGLREENRYLRQRIDSMRSQGD